MNSKAQFTGVGIALVIGITLFMIGMLNIGFIKDEVTRARTGLSCSSTSISDGTRMVCLTIDLVVPYFIVIIIAAAGGLITSRFIGG